MDIISRLNSKIYSAELELGEDIVVLLPPKTIDEINMISPSFSAELAEDKTLFGRKVHIDRKIESEVEVVTTIQFKSMNQPIYIKSIGLDRDGLIITMTDDSYVYTCFPSGMSCKDAAYRLHEMAELMAQK